MRMWMCNPKIMCRQHLLGEYRELFTIVGSLRKQISLQGYFDNDLIQPLYIKRRYNELRTEMIRRGYSPKKPFLFSKLMTLYLGEKRLHKIDAKKSLLELLTRCPECNERYKSFKSSWNKGLTKESNIIMYQISENIRKRENDKEWKETIGKHKSEKIKRALIQTDHTSWNKGLNKFNCQKVAVIGKNISETFQNMSSEEKAVISRKLRVATVKRIATGQVPNKQYFNTRPEQKFKQMLDALHITYKHNYPILNIEHAYPVDFYLPNHKLVIEIDGMKWHNWPNGNEIDIIREQELLATGLKTIRFWDKELRVLDLDILNETIQNIKVKNG